MWAHRTWEHMQHYTTNNSYPLLKAKVNIAIQFVTVSIQHSETSILQQIRWNTSLWHGANYLVHVAAKQLILFLHSLNKTLWSNNTGLFLCLAYLHDTQWAPLNSPLHSLWWKISISCSNTDTQGWSETMHWQQRCQVKDLYHTNLNDIRIILYAMLTSHPPNLD